MPTNLMESVNQPSYEEFLAYWQKHDQYYNSWRAIVPYAVYILGLALFTMLLHRIAPFSVLWIIISIFGIAFMLLPISYALVLWKRNKRFLRCTKCGDWLGRDLSGAWSGPNPKWKIVCQDGHCVKCGFQILWDLSSRIENNIENNTEQEDSRRPS